MRIAIAAHSARRIGGVETYLAGIVPALQARGHDVACWFETDAMVGEPIVTPGCTGPVWTASARSACPLEQLAGWKPEVIYQHGLRSEEIERQLTEIAPVAFFAHSYYGSCISGEKATRLPMVTPCGRVFGPACLAHYLPRRCGGLSPITMVGQYRRQRAKQRLLNAYGAVLVASRHMAGEYERQGIRARVVRLPVGQGESECPARATDEGVRLLFLGRLEWSKGVQVALEASALAAAALRTRIHLVVAGRGSLAATLQQQADELMRRVPGLTIEFPGWLAETGRPAVFRTSDLLLMPSLWPEPFGLSGVEAAAAGVPAIAFQVGGMDEWLVDGVTGTAVPMGARAVQRFADGVVGLLSDRARLAAMSRQAAERARSFTMASHLDHLERVFVDLVGSASHRRSA